MIDIVGRKKWYFAFSLTLIASSIVALIFWGLNLGIDFTGGSLVEVSSSRVMERDVLERQLEEGGINVSSITPTDSGTYIIRTQPLNEEEHQRLLGIIESEFGEVEEVAFETIGPTIGSELLQKAITALVLATVAIILYIAWSFRSVPRPASSWRFGVCAIIALLHDVIIVLGLFSVLGYFLKVEVDSLFVTALLTLIGFSVHDTIVVFDRIRENLSKGSGESFASVVNNSIIETIVRSLNTSFTVVLVLVPVLLFGGTSIFWFTVALLVGIVAGVYSSIFNAAPLLVVWQEWSEKRLKRKSN